MTKEEIENLKDMAKKAGISKERIAEYIAKIEVAAAYLTDDAFAQSMRDILAEKLGVK